MIPYLKSFITGYDDRNNKGTKLLIAGKLEDHDEAPDINEIEGQTDDSSQHEANKSEEAKHKENQQEQSYHFIDYKVLPDDTLYGIALSYLMNPAVLKRDNGLELDEVFAGQVLKVRVRDPPPETDLSQSTEASKTSLDADQTQKKNSHDQKEIVKSKSRKISNEIIAIDKWDVYYCTSIGDIEGTLVTESTKLVFSPLELTKSNLKSRDQGESENNSIFKEDYEKKYISQWGAEIMIQDIAECNIMVVPGTLCEEHFGKHGEYEKDYLLQIILYGHGNKSMGKYLNDIFSRMKGDKVAYACVYFKIKKEIDENNNYSNKQKQIMAHQLHSKILAIKQSLQEKEAETAENTELPYFEFLFERFQKRDADLLRKISRKESAYLPILSESEREKILKEIYEEDSKQEEKPAVPRKLSKKMMIPKIVDESQILNLEQFTELINCVPELFQTLQWRLAYSTAIHGTSYQNLLRRTQYESPSLIVIKDENNFIFGAYCSNEIWYSQDYYGTGETFLFTFRDLNEISTFYWSKKNNLFLFVNEEGVMVGAGPHYGLWFNNELTKGRSFECQTFDSPMLSYKTDFQIMKLEVWTIIDPFTSTIAPKQQIVEVEENEEMNKENRLHSESEEKSS